MTNTTVSIHRIRRGFSLAETMIAIGILGIGMTMAASLFPAALQESERASSSQLGSLICENALALAQAVLVPADVQGSAELKLLNPTLEATSDATRRIYTSDPSTGAVTYYKCIYPTNATNPAYAYLLFGREVSASKARLVVVAYRITNPASAATAYYVKAPLLQLVPSDPADPTKPMTTRIKGGGGKLLTNTPVINPVSGEIAICVSGDGEQGELDRVMSSQLPTTGSIVIVDPAVGGSRLSPAISAVSIEAGI